MSNGGALGFTDTCKLYKEKIGKVLEVKGIVFDSAPREYDFSTAYYGIAQNFPKGVVWYPVAGISWVGLTLLGKTRWGPCEKIEGSRGGLNNFNFVDKSATRFYIYSEVDGVVGWESVERHALEAVLLGVKYVSLEKWEGSGHVLHMLRDSVRYWGVAEKLWDSAVTEGRT